MLKLSEPDEMTPRRPTWPAALVLLYLSPLIAEVMSGSTPPLMFIQPFSFLYLPTLYGVSAILIHEVLVRRKLGWGNVLLMGASFGIFQEALIVQTWFNFKSPGSPSYDLGGHGVLLDTAWGWGLNLTFYHAVISMTVPLILITLLYPRRSAQPWFSRRGIVVLIVWLMVPSILVALLVANKALPGYAGPPLIPYLITVGLTVITFYLGYKLRFPVPHPRPDRAAPGLWTVRLTIFAITFAYFVVTMVLVHPLPTVIEMLLSIGMFALGVWRVRSWSVRGGWGERHWLAVCTGILLFFIVIWGPLVEFTSSQPGRSGLVLFNLIALVGLIVLDRRLKSAST